MLTSELLILDFGEIRRRSIKLWEAIPPELYSWRPDRAALTSLEMVRHVLESEHLYHVIMDRRGMAEDYISPWHGRPCTTVSDEIAFAVRFRKDFLSAVRSITPAELTNVEINRNDLGQKGPLGKFLLKVAYHESVHAGQFLSYLRTLGVDRPLIWD